MSAPLSGRALEAVSEGIMRKFSLTLQQLSERLREQSAEVTMLRAALDIQCIRIAQMQAELDSLPQARRRRQMLRALLNPQPSSNGHGNGHRAGIPR